MEEIINETVTVEEIKVYFGAPMAKHCFRFILVVNILNFYLTGSVLFSATSVKLA